ncbi:MAG: Unknown protein [uncultured Sulfurovum sp.]|uniref:Glycosyltransferase RgtA/B/C/D-like domain-containing protein n=1 Tax=uncultured Sulfurovum sp. TaxID=269237 RepID=A0A6S6TFT7_9BACT|nr:MAG: Unknown protein [uncultured Sulfurovum sp.]
MIFIHVLIGLLSIFVSPHILLHKLYKHINLSLRFSYGIIISYTVVWILVLINYYLNLPDVFTLIFVYIIFLLSVIDFLRSKYNFENTSKTLILLLVSLVILIPLFSHIGVGFRIIDALASWNKWGIELYNNEYNPINAAYPVLQPGIWSLIYKIQGNSDIWWTAQLTLFAIPLLVILQLIILYNESKNITYIIMSILLLPYFYSSHVYNGNMDIPVMLLGMLSLIILYTAELHKNEKSFEYYIYASLLLAGIASITKQAGLAFIVFNVIYILFNVKSFTYKKRLLYVIIGSMLYFISYLSLYYQNNIAPPLGNIDHLAEIAEYRYNKESISEILAWAYKNFFLLPEKLPLIDTIKVKYFTLSLMILGLILFMFKDLRKYNNIAFLSAVYFILSSILWFFYFSYDERNALWVKTFYIIFFSINISYLISYFPYNLKYITASIFILLVGFLFNKNDLAYRVQEKSQQGICEKYKCVNSVNEAKKLLDAHQDNTCMQIYTNEMVMHADALVKAYKNKFILVGRDYHYQNFEFLEHDCVKGRYIIFRQNSTLRTYEWSKVIKLHEERVIQRVKNTKGLVFFVPANTKLPDDYFNNMPSNHGNTEGTL